MKLYLQTPLDRRESKELMEEVRDRLPSRFEILNSDLNVDLYLAERADAIITRTDGYDDATWAVIGMANAGKRPVIPLWYGAERAHPYGFWEGLHSDEARLRIRNKSDEREWPNKEIKGVLTDIKLLEQRNEWRNNRIEKPEKEKVDLNLPLYIIGDSRGIENAWNYYDVKERFNESGIDCFIPPEVIDGDYNIEDYPKRINMNSGDVEDCGEYASFKSSFLVGRTDQKFLLGSRWEEGVAWFNSKPILYLYKYIFPPRRPFEKYLDGKKQLGVYSSHLSSVFKQNEDLWGIRIHEALTEEELSGVINRARIMRDRELENKLKVSA